MAWVIYIMLGMIFLVMIVAISILIKGAGGRTNAARYDVFEVSGDQLTVLAGIPVTYDIAEIERITFSVMKAPKSMSSYNGIMKIVKTNSKKSRPFMFNSSAYTKKMVLSSSRQEIEQTIHFLMAELKRYHIPCSQVM